MSEPEDTVSHEAYMERRECERLEQKRLEDAEYEHAHDIIQLVRELEAERRAHQETRVLLTALRTGDDDRVQRLRDENTELAKWKEAIIDACVVDWIFTKEHETNPRKAVNDLLCWQQKIALDPAVSKDAHELHAEIQRLRDARDFQRERADKRVAVYERQALELERLRDGLATLVNDWKQSAERTRQGKGQRTREQSGWEVLANCADQIQSLLTPISGGSNAQ